MAPVLGSTCRCSPRRGQSARYRHGQEYRVFAVCPRQRCRRSFSTLDPPSLPWCTHNSAVPIGTRMRIETRGPVMGVCYICGQNAKLTNDHTLPTMCLRWSHLTHGHCVCAGRRSVACVTSPLPGRREFRSLCARCNNEIPGAEYDPELVSCTKEVYSQRWADAEHNANQR
jgi:hypothetical protein